MNDQKDIQILLTEHRQRISWLEQHIMEALDIYGYYRESMPVKVCIKHSPDADHVRVRIGDDTWDFESKLSEYEILEQMVDTMHRIADVTNKIELVRHHDLIKGIWFDYNVGKDGVLTVHKDWHAKISETTWNQYHYSLEIGNAYRMTVDQIAEYLHEDYQRYANSCHQRDQQERQGHQRASLTAEKPKTIWQKLKRIFQ